MREIHARYRRRLEELLTSPDAPPEGELTRALYAVFDPAALADPLTRRRAEPFLADLICRTAPRSDVILDRAAAAFGWNEMTSEAADPAIAQVVARLALRREGDRSARLDRLLRDGGQPGDPPLIAPLTLSAARRASSRGGTTGYWVAGVLVAVLAAATAGLVIIATAHHGPPEDVAGGAPPPPGTAESAAPQVAVSNGRVEIVMASTETSDSFIQCDDVAASALQGCRVERSTMSDNGAAALDYVRSLRFSGGDPSIEGGRSIEVHVHWKDMS